MIIFYDVNLQKNKKRYIKFRSYKLIASKDESERTFFTMLVLEKNKRRYIKFSFFLQTNFHCIDSKQNQSIN